MSVGDFPGLLEVALGRVLDLVAKMLHVPAKTFSGAAGTDREGGKSQSQQAKAGAEGRGAGGRFHGGVWIEVAEWMRFPASTQPFCMERAPALPPFLLAYPQPVINAPPIPGPALEWQPARRPRPPSGKMPAGPASKAEPTESARLQDGFSARLRLRGSGMGWGMGSASGVSRPRFNSFVLMRSQ